MNPKPELEKLLSLLNPNYRILELGRSRQASVGKDESTDYLPLILEGVPVLERNRYCQDDKDYCRYNYKEQFYDKEKMLFEQLWGLISTARGRSDAQLSVEPRMGAAFLPSVLGLIQEIFEDKDPWLQERLSKQEIGRLKLENLEDVSKKGFMPQALEYISYFRKILAGKASVHIAYTWGPFSLAHLIRGNEIFTDLYDDPPFVYHLMDIATQLYVKCSALLKKAVGEPIDQGYHGSFYMSNSGVWSNEDTAADFLISPSQAENFVFPYLRKAYRPFGGAVVHFCGRADYLLDSLLGLPEVKGINFGEPEKQKLPYEQIMKMLLDRGKVYYGSWPKRDGESTESYFRRILEPLGGEKGGLVLSYNLNKEEQRNPEKVMELWHLLQG